MNASTPPRFNGTLKKWNVERGFGFVVAEHGDQELFVHVSVFPRDGHQPVVGEPLSFEIELGKDGRKRAAHVRRPGVASTVRARPKDRLVDTERNRSRRSSQPVQSSSMAGTVIVIALLLVLGWFGYRQYQEHVSARSASTASPQRAVAAPANSATSESPANSSFQCDGRTHCSQMTSCHEAKLFLKHCPGVQMDGNGDGVPCERQWCTGPFGGG